MASSQIRPSCKSTRSVSAVSLTTQTDQSCLQINQRVLLCSRKSMPDATSEPAARLQPERCHSLLPEHYVQALDQSARARTPHLLPWGHLSHHLLQRTGTVHRLGPKLRLPHRLPRMVQQWHLQSEHLFALSSFDGKDSSIASVGRNPPERAAACIFLRHGQQ